MSYGLTVKAPTKAEAKVAAEAAFDKMVETQPIHARDKAAAMANVSAVVDLLVDDETKHVSVSMNGYVSWTNVLEPDGSNDLSAVSVAASAALVNAEG